MMRLHYEKVAAILVLAVIGCFAPALADVHRGRCTTAWIPHPVVLPDGSVHEPGALRICLRTTSPVSGGHEVSMNGRTHGHWPSRIGYLEAADDPRPVMVFRWTAEGRLRLVGYARPDGEGMITWVFHNYDRDNRSLATEAATLLDPRRREEFAIYLAQDLGR